MKRKSSRVQDLDLTMRRTSTLNHEVTFSKEQVITALRDYLHKHGREVPPSDVSVFCYGAYSHSLAESSNYISFAWHETVAERTPDD